MRTLLSTLLLWSTVSLGASAELRVVSDYAKALNKASWKHAKSDQVPSGLITKERIELSSKAFKLCYQSCKSFGPLSEWDRIEQENISYWLERYFTYTNREFGWRPKRPLTVITQRPVKDEDGKKAMVNNAFFAPDEESLSFLPSRTSLLYKILGSKMARSGLDPSVILHEVSHAFFHDLVPVSLNDELDGLSEGFSDYMANVILGTPELGAVILQGKVGRNSSSPTTKDGSLKVYESRLESHEQGERVALALWKSRQVVPDKQVFDRSVIQAVRAIGRNPFGTLHHFKELIIAQAPEAQPIFDQIFPGEVERIQNLDRLSSPNFGTESLMGFSIKQGRQGVLDDELEFTIHRNLSLSPTQKAILLGNDEDSDENLYWAVFDTYRGVVLGLYDTQGALLTERARLQALAPIVRKLNSVAPFVTDVLKKLKGMAGLAKKEGPLKTAYAVKERTVHPRAVVFGGQKLEGQGLKMKLKRRLIARLILDMPRICELELHLAPVPNPALVLPEIDGKTVVGYKLILENGSQVEVDITRALLTE